MESLMETIVLVLEDPKLVNQTGLVNLDTDTSNLPIALVSGTPNSIERVRYRERIVLNIYNLMGACADLLCLIQKKGVPEDCIVKFGLYEKDVVYGLVCLDRLGLLEKTVKTFAAWLPARLLGNDLPEAIPGIDYTYLLGKRVRRFLRCRVPPGAIGKAPKKDQVKLVDSFLKIKSVLPDVPASFINESARKYQKTLSASPPGGLERLSAWVGGGRGSRVVVGDGVTCVQLIERLMDAMEEEEGQLGRSILKTVDEVFRPIPASRIRDDASIPSVSSSLNYTREGGGAWQELVDLELPYNFHWDELVSMYWAPRSGMTEVRGRPLELSGSYVEVGGRAPARTAAVLEACKVRWVSIGDASQYYRAKTWNRDVYSQMPDHKTFALTARPLTEEDVQGMTLKYVLSGDYSSATDTLDPHWSEFAFEAITRRLYAHASPLSIGGTWEQRFQGLKPMLTEHTLAHKLDQERPGYTHFDQNIGQLMGSYLSFPVLCVVNAAVNRLFLDPTLTIPIRELPLLVNGDDVMMASDQPFEGWAEHVSLAGLTPSLGKNYVHTHACCLNSEFYWRKNYESAWERVHPWRVNLIYENHALLGGDVHSRRSGREAGIGPAAQTLVAHHPLDEQDVLLSRFIKIQSKTLKSTNRSWWVPTQLGGLGLPVLRLEVLKKVTPLARLLATYLVTRPDPEHTLMCAPRNSADTTSANMCWSATNAQYLRHLGYSYQWLTNEERGVLPPQPEIGMKHFLGYGSRREPGNTQIGVYQRVLKKAQCIRGALDRGALTLMSDELLLDWSQNPRIADWVPPHFEPDLEDPVGFGVLKFDSTEESSGLNDEEVEASN